MDSNNFILNKSFSYLIPDKGNEHLPNAFIPKIDFPIGDKVLDVILENNFIWLSTNKGLFSYNINIQTWESHFLALPNIYGSENLLVTNKAIYSSGYSSNSLSWPWARIDKKTHKIQVFEPGSRIKAYTNSFKSVSDEIIFATPEGLNIYNYKKNSYKRIPTPSSIGQVSFYGNNFLASNSTEVMLITRDESVSPIYTFSKELPKSKWREAPELMEVDQETVWVSHICYGSHCSLLKIDLTLNTQTEYLFKGKIVKIIPDSLYTWIISTSRIYRYDNTKKSMIELGAIKSDSFNNYYKTEFILDAVIHDEMLYIAGRKGIYRFNCISQELLRFNQQFYKNFQPYSIEYDENVLYVSAGVGIFQLSVDYFNQNLKLNPNFEFSKEIESNYIFPLTIQDTIAFPSNRDNALLFFNLKEAYENNIVSGINLYHKLKVHINSEELRIFRGVGTADGIENIYYIRINKSDLDQSNNSLEVLISDSSDKVSVIKKWIVINDSP